jgi:hypothetical protein
MAARLAKIKINNRGQHGEKKRYYGNRSRNASFWEKMQIKAGHLQATSHLSNPDLIKMPNRL